MRREDWSAKEGSFINDVMQLGGVGICDIVTLCLKVQLKRPFSMAEVGMWVNFWSKLHDVIYECSLSMKDFNWELFNRSLK